MNYESPDNKVHNPEKGNFLNAIGAERNLALLKQLGISHEDGTTPIRIKPKIKSYTYEDTVSAHQEHARKHTLSEEESQRVLAIGLIRDNFDNNHAQQLLSIYDILCKEASTVYNETKGPDELSALKEELSKERAHLVEAWKDTIKNDVFFKEKFEKGGLPYSIFEEEGLIDLSAKAFADLTITEMQQTLRENGLGYTWTSSHDSRLKDTSPSR